MKLEVSFLMNGKAVHFLLDILVNIWGFTITVLAVGSCYGTGDRRQTRFFLVVDHYWKLTQINSVDAVKLIQNV